MKSVALTAVLALCLTTLAAGQCAVTNANNPGASLTLNGGTSFAGCSGVPVTMNFTSDQIGNPFDICFGPLAASCTVLTDDALELDMPNSLSVFGGVCAGATLPVVGFGFGAGSVDFTFISAAGIGNLNNLQAGAVDFTDPDGISLSEVNTYIVAPAVFPWTTVGDDSFVDLTGDPCWTDVNFYGTTYNGAFVSSNGGISFGSGYADFSATLGEWETEMPRIGIHSDLEPNNFGGITINFLTDGVSVDYDTAEWGTAGANTLAYTVEVSASAGARISGITTAGAWGTGTVCGITDGAAGTHPGAVSFDAILGGLGLVGAATDSWLDANPAGMIVGAGVTVNNINWPNADGSLINGN